MSAMLRRAFRFYFETAARMARRPAGGGNLRAREPPTLRLSWREFFSLMGISIGATGATDFSRPVQILAGD